MGYAHISNLYKDQTILLFKEVYCLEKIHGTSAHIKWKANEKKLVFFSGGEKHERFVELFDVEFLTNYFITTFIDSDVTIYGEAYGGKQQGMKNTYGDKLKFIAFDVQQNNWWMTVPDAEKLCLSLNLEFVDYVKTTTDLEVLNFERDKDSVQAIRNGIGEGKLREGVVIKPLFEFTDTFGERVIVKHKRDEFKETKTTRNLDDEQLKVLTDAKLIVDEWVTEQRLHHVLDKIDNISMENMKNIISAMIEDVYREGKGEIVESKEVLKLIGSTTVKLFKQYLNNKMNELV